MKDMKVGSEECIQTPTSGRIESFLPSASFLFGKVLIMSETPGSEGDETGWETASSNPTPTTKQFPPAQLPGPEEKAEKNKDRRKVSDDPIEQYWRHRGRLVKHLEKRFEQFQKRSREDYDRARNPYPPKAKKPAVQQPAPAPVPGPVPAQITPPRQAGKKAAAQSAVRKTEVEGKTGMSLRAVSAVGNGAKARVAAVRVSESFQLAEEERKTPKRG